jgi:hypothetical protein
MSNPKNKRTRCEATVEDYERPAFHWHGKVMSPGAKQCSRYSVEVIGKIALCRTHLRMAREGFVEPTGDVRSKLDIRAARSHPAMHPHGLCNWVHKLPRERTLLGPTAALHGEFVVKLDDGCEIWRLKAKDPRFSHCLGIVPREDLTNARSGKAVALFGLHDQDHVEWSQIRNARSRR